MIRRLSEYEAPPGLTPTRRPVNALVVPEKGDVEGAIKRLKRKLTNGGVHAEMKQAQYFTPPGERRRQKKAKARGRVTKVRKRRELREAQRDMRKPEYRSRRELVPAA